MANEIIYAPSAGKYQIAADTPSILMTNLITVLGNHGWTTQANSFVAKIKFGAIQNNDAVLYLYYGHAHQRAYTWKTTLTGAANEVKRGATVAECASNFAAAINDTGVEGTNYGTGTTQNADFIAEVSGSDPTVVILTQRDTSTIVYAGDIAYRNTDNSTYYIRVDGTQVGNLSANTNYYPFEGGGAHLHCAPTPDGLMVTVTMFTNIAKGATALSFLVNSGPVPLTYSSTSGYYPCVWCTATRLLDVIANDYQFYIYRAGEANVRYCTELFVSCLKLADENAPAFVSNVENSGGLVKITTSAAHGLVTGNQVHLSGIKIDSLYVPYLEATFNITVVDATSYTLNGSSYPGGTYTEGGVAGLTSGQATGAAYIACNGIKSGANVGDVIEASTANASYRKSAVRAFASSTGSFVDLSFCVVNGELHGMYTIDMATYARVLNSLCPMGAMWVANIAYRSFSMFGNKGVIQAPLLFFPLSSYDFNNMKGIGYFWHALTTTAKNALDSTATFDSHNWVGLTDASDLGNVWMAIN